VAEACSFGWAVAAGSAVFSAGRAGAKALPATPPRMTSGARAGPCLRFDGMAATFSFATAGKGSPMAMIDGVCGAGVPSVTMDGVAAGKDLSMTTKDEALADPAVSVAARASIPGTRTNTNNPRFRRPYFRASMLLCFDG